VAHQERPDRYRDASPIERLPFSVLQAFFTGQMFAAHAVTYEAATRKAGDTVQLVALPNAGHFVFIDPQSDVWPQVLKSVRRLLAMEP
jgi:acetyl esterase/lipase